MSEARGWLVAYCAPALELEVIANIERAGGQAWTPCQWVARFSRGKKFLRMRPLFPRYVFADEPGEWRWLEDVDGVEQILTNNGRPLRVPGEIVAVLQRAESTGIFDSPTAALGRLELGDRVKILDPQFFGKRGVVAEFCARMRSASQQKRAKVLISALGRMVRVEVAVGSLEKLPLDG